VTGELLVRRLARFGYETLRQRGSHRTPVTQQCGRNKVNAPMHKPIKVGTLEDILTHVAEHHKLSVEALIEQLELA
jgi:predicted RNA binding protein YcfA (HicA-like mRNA interferase family)